MKHSSTYARMMKRRDFLIVNMYLEIETMFVLSDLFSKRLREVDDLFDVVFKVCAPAPGSFFPAAPAPRGQKKRLRLLTIG